MWNDVDDLVKDLVQLNTFGTPIDEKSYHMFYMNDNYPKPKNKGETKKKNVESFLDPRTGEEISVVPDVTYETTGYRDNSDMKTLWADLELQNQLKLVRQKRPNDTEVAHYYNNRSSRVGPSTSKR